MTEHNHFSGLTISVAKKLLGSILIHDSTEGKTSGIIVEVEAYLANDPASHSYRGKTKRNEPMFGKEGTAYVYFTYGMHHCFNVVTGPKGIGEAVLIRALEPLEGIDLMKKRRKQNKIEQLCNGPAKLVQAMGIGKEHNTKDLREGKLRIEWKEPPQEKQIVTTTRIGIKKGAEQALRFYLTNSPFISKK